MKIDKLKDFEEFKTFRHKEKAKILQYIEYTYSKESELIQSYPSLKKRKEMAVVKSGLDIKDDFVQELMELQAINKEEDEFVKAITSLINFYLKNQCDNAFEMLISNQQMFWEFQARIRKPMSEDLDEDKALKAVEIKDKLARASEEAHKRIQNLYKEIYGEEDKMQKEAEKIVRITPELMAQKKNV